jgi:TPP-dependent pyruvate/acetoin dehydrogenase alpha subunit
MDASAEESVQPSKSSTQQKNGNGSAASTKTLHSSPNGSNGTTKFQPIVTPTPKNLTRDQLLGLMFNLKKIRIFEETISRMSRQGKIIGGVYLGRGQEAISVGTTFDLRNDDIVSPIHRDMGVFLLKGMPMRNLMCQILGRRAGPSKGKDSWSHTGDMRYNILASSSMLGSSVPIACGASLATRMRGLDSVSVTYFGEGSTARGDIHEAMNMAAIYNLPVLFICENNQWAYSTPPDREIGGGKIAKRASAYGMEGISIDANDILLVYQTVREAIHRARQGQGPTFIECVTYRMMGHSEHDQAAYMDKSQTAVWARRDPIGRFRQLLEQSFNYTESEDKRMTERIEAEIADARKFAESQPFPDGPEALEGVFVP